MPTPIYICGAECGIAAIGTTPPTGVVRHWGAAGAAASVSTTTFNSAGGGIRSYRFNPSASATTGQLRTGVLATIAAPATIVARFYVRFATLPDATCFLFSVQNLDGQTGVAFDSSDSTLKANANATLAASGAAVTTGVWYRVDVKVVGNTTYTVDIQVDGVAQAQASAAGSSVGATQYNIGAFGAANTSDVFIDDLIISGTSGDYPIGQGYVAGLYPNADGSHSYSATTDFLDGGDALAALAASGSEVDTWQSLQNPGSTTVDTANYITNQTATGSERLEWQFDNLPAAAATVNGVMLVSGQHASGTATCLATLQVNDNATINAVYTDADFSDTTVVTAIKTYATAPSTSAAWSTTLVNGVRVRWLGSADVNPDPRFDFVLFEADYVTAGSAQALTGTGAVSNTGRTQAELQARITGRGAVANTGVASSQLSLAFTGRSANSTAGTAATQLALGFAGHGDVATTGTANLTVEADTGDAIAFTGSGAVTNTGRVDLSVLADFTGKGTNATTGTAATQLALDFRGHGDAATTGRAAATLSLPVTGHGDVAVDARGAVVLSAVVRGHGDAATAGTTSAQLSLSVAGRGANATTGTSAVTLALDLTGKSTNATTGRAQVTLAADLAGHGDASTTGTAVLTLQGRADLTGFGANATTGRAATVLALVLSGHADSSTTGNAAANLSVRLSGSGANSTAGSAALSELDSEIAAQEPRFLPGPPARQHRVFRTRIRLRLTIITHYTPVPVVWSGALNVVVGAVTLVEPRCQQVHRRLERTARVRDGCRRTKVYSGPIEARTAERRSYRRELLTVGPELLL